ncbi:hypothetical protein NECAME_15757 [Necator americanus]|uniref:EGF-like domain-containing protein n=1 Tax=Necator americanus TaxID=51031 RepID=W2SIG8_NECAM|nr:hypothetical protein NECAME_15757 [Necator americanus]ETN68552.1 hypothetical protein NECAME_15757 [Necator americanus]
MAFNQSQYTNNVSGIGYDFGKSCKQAQKDLCPKSYGCKNGGFRHPSNCKICVCPGGYAGPLCGRKSPNNIRIEMKVEPYKSPFDDNDLYCNEAGVEIKAIKDQRLTGYK